MSYGDELSNGSRRPKGERTQRQFLLPEERNPDGIVPLCSPPPPSTLWFIARTTVISVFHSDYLHIILPELLNRYFIQFRLSHPHPHRDSSYSLDERPLLHPISSFLSCRLDIGRINNHHPPSSLFLVICFVVVLIFFFNKFLPVLMAVVWSSVTLAPSPERC